LPPTDQPSAVNPPAGDGSLTDPVGSASSSSPVVDSFAATPQHRHRHHGALTW
jgi:hypothetical protein